GARHALGRSRTHVVENDHPARSDLSECSMDSAIPILGMSRRLAREQAALPRGSSRDRAHKRGVIPMSRALTSYALALVVAGCASAPTMPTSQRPLRSNHETLVAADLASYESSTATLWDAVRQLRPNFLQPRLGANAVRGVRPTIAVYINDVYAGESDVLRLFR